MPTKPKNRKPAGSGKQGRGPSYPILESALELFRQRKEQKGISITRSLEDCLTFGTENKEAWF